MREWWKRKRKEAENRLVEIWTKRREEKKKRYVVVDVYNI